MHIYTTHSTYARIAETLDMPRLRGQLFAIRQFFRIRAATAPTNPLRIQPSYSMWSVSNASVVTMMAAMYRVYQSRIEDEMEQDDDIRAVTDCCYEVRRRYPTTFDSEAEVYPNWWGRTDEFRKVKIGSRQYLKYQGAITACMKRLRCIVGPGVRLKDYITRRYFTIHPRLGLSLSQLDFLKVELDQLGAPAVRNRYNIFPELENTHVYIPYVGFHHPGDWPTQSLAYPELPR